MSTLLVVGPTKAGKSHFINDLLGAPVLATSELSVPFINVVEPGAVIERQWLTGDSPRILSDDDYRALMDSPPPDGDATLIIECRAPFPKTLKPRRIVEAPLGADLLPLTENKCVVILLHEYGIDRPTYAALLLFFETLKRSSNMNDVAITQIPSHNDACLSVERDHLALELARISRMQILSRSWDEALKHARKG